MARPKKNTDTTEARQRICDALWELLETHELRDVTVGMITAKADCNRGTFYYHFKGIDELLGEMIANDIMQKQLVADFIFRLSTGDEAAVRDMLNGNLVHRLSIIVNHAGIELAFGKIFELLIDIWSSLLCSEGEKLKPEAQAIVLYYIGGILSLVAACPHEHMKNTQASEGILRFVLENARFVTNQIYTAQGLTEEIASERLKTVVQFLDSVN